MEPQKNASAPDGGSQDPRSANAPTEAMSPSLSQEAASAAMPTAPVAGQKIEPQTTTPSADAANDKPAPMTAGAQDVGATQNTEAEPALPVDTPPAPPPVGPPKHRKKGLLVGLIVAAVVLLLSGGAAAAYFGYYAPNQPENVLNRALANSVDQTKAKSTEFTGELTYSEEASGDMKATLEGAFDAESGATKLDMSWDALVTTITLNLLSADGKTFYVKFGGLEGLDSMLQGIAMGEPTLGSAYASAITGLSDQWLQINESMVKSALGSDKASPALSGDDRKAIAQAYTNHQFLSIKDVLPDAKINGKDSHHYRLAFDAGQFAAFNRALKDANSSLFSADEETIKGLEQELSKFNTSKLNLEVWISKKDKMFTQFALTYKPVSLLLTVKSYNKPVDVKAPEDAKSILEALGGVLGGGTLQSDLTLPTLEQDFQTGISL